MGTPVRSRCPPTRLCRPRGAPSGITRRRPGFPAAPGPAASWPISAAAGGGRASHWLPPPASLRGNHAVVAPAARGERRPPRPAGVWVRVWVRDRHPGARRGPAEPVSHPGARTPFLDWPCAPSRDPLPAEESSPCPAKGPSARSSMGLSSHSRKGIELLSPPRDAAPIPLRDPAPIPKERSSS